MSKICALTTVALCSSVAALPGVQWKQVQWKGLCLDVKDNQPPFALQLWECHDEYHADFPNQVFGLVDDIAPLAQQLKYYPMARYGDYTTPTTLAWENVMRDGAKAVMGARPCQNENCFRQEHAGPKADTRISFSGFPNGYHAAKDCLDVKDGKHYNGAPLQMWQCFANNDNQLFYTYPSPWKGFSQNSSAVGAALTIAPPAVVQADCLGVINGFRSQTGAPPLQGSQTPDSGCQHEQAVYDCANGAHASSGKCSEGAQCEAMNNGGCSAAVQSFEDEGPGGGHYKIMHSSKYCTVSWSMVPKCYHYQGFILDFWTFDFFACPSEANKTSATLV